jgi:hypothetical protein
MQVLRLRGHYGSTVEIDLCAPCHLVWFDPVESARLAGPGLLALIGEMAAAQRLAHQPLRAGLGCPHCLQPTRTVHNRTRWGRSLQLECPGQHGAWQTFGQFLYEKGLLRPMGSADRHRALEGRDALHCVNCGGALAREDATCPWCSAVPAVVDVARLARALDTEGATLHSHAAHATRTRHAALGCQACGAPVPAEAGWLCRQCGATLTAAGLGEAFEIVQALEAPLQAHADRPVPAVVRLRLQAQEPGLQRQRERTAALQAEADAASGRSGWAGSDGSRWHSQRPGGWPSAGLHGRSRWTGLLHEDLRDLPHRLPPWAWAVLAAGALLAWWWWR